MDLKQNGFVAPQPVLGIEGQVIANELSWADACAMLAKRSCIELEVGPNVFHAAEITSSSILDERSFGGQCGIRIVCCSFNVNRDGTFNRFSSTHFVPIFDGTINCADLRTTRGLLIRFLDFESKTRYAEMAHQVFENMLNNKAQHFEIVNGRCLRQTDSSFELQHLSGDLIWDDKSYLTYSNRGVFSQKQMGHHTLKQPRLSVQMNGGRFRDSYHAFTFRV